MHRREIAVTTNASCGSVGNMVGAFRNILRDTSLRSVVFANISSAATSSAVMTVCTLLLQLVFVINTVLYREKRWRIIQSIDVFNIVDRDVSCTTASVREFLARHFSIED